MNKEILKLAIPNILSNISVPLLSTVDTLLMGRMSAAHLGAVGLGSMMFNFIYWNFGFLRMGSTGMTAQAYGRNDHSEISNVLGRALVLSISLALIIYIFKTPLLHISSGLLNVDPDQMHLVSEYFYIRLYAAPATLALYAMMGWYFGMQNALIPLVLTIASNIINMGLSAYLVRTMNLGIAGVAWGTVIAQYFAVLLGLVFLLKKYPDYFKHILKKSIFQWSELRSFLSVNKDLFIRTVGLTFAFGFFYSQSSKSGELILAANVVLLQFLNWMSYGVDGFAYAAESIVGKYYGRNDDRLMKKSINYSFLWGLALALLFTLLYWVIGNNLLHVFTDKVEIIDASKHYLWWMIIFPLLSFQSYIWDGIYIGFTAGKAMRDSMFVSLAFFLLIFYTTRGLGNHGLWFSLLCLLIARGVFQTILYMKHGKNLK